VLQGEILGNVVQAHLRIDTIFDAEPVVTFKVHTLAMVLSQDCELDWDFKARQGKVGVKRMIPAVLCCELQPANDLRVQGKPEIDSDKWREIKNNAVERYHYLPAVPPAQDALGEGLPDLAMDFRRFFTVSAEELYARLKKPEPHRRTFLLSPYREHLSMRFYYFQMRIALPEQEE